MSESSSLNKSPPPTTPPPSEKASSEVKRAYSSTPISKPKAKTGYSSGAHLSEKIKSEKLSVIRTSVMAEYEDSVVPGGPKFLEAKFPDVLYKKFSEPKDSIRLVNDPNPVPFDPELFGLPLAEKSSDENQPVQPPPESYNEMSDDETQKVHPPPDSPQPSIDVTDDIEHESSQPIEPLRRRRSTRLATSKVPVAVDHIDAILSYLKSKGMYNQRKSRWATGCPANVKGAEGDLSDYLNKVVDDVRAFLNGGTKPKNSGDDWVYTARYANNPVPCDGPDRKPDIAVIQRKYEEDPELEMSWDGIRSFGELKSGSEGPKGVIGQLAQYSRLCFGHEKARRFVLCFKIIGDKMQLFKFDRSGVVYSHEFDMHKAPRDFLRVIVGMIIGDDYYLGLDPSFVENRGKTWVYLNGKRYEFVKNLLLERTNRGRGTIALLVRRESDGMECVIKDQWVDTSRKLREPDTLEYLMIKDVGRVAKIEDYQIVHFEVEGETVKDSTENDRIPGSVAETRDHFRLLISPYGDKLENFRSLKELVSAFKDYVEIIEELIEADIVHRDISPGNVILVEDEANPTGPRKGYIIDFDYAILQSRQEDDHAKGKRTGTYPFMSMAVLKGLDTANEAHDYYHDLESLFYILVWTCLTQEGPNGAARPISDFSSNDSPITKWCDIEASLEDIADRKGGMMSNWPDFKSRVFVHMKKYFAPLELLFTLMREIIFRNTPSLEPRFVDGKIVAGKSLGDIPDDQRSMRDRDRKRVFKEIKDLLDVILESKEIQDEAVDIEGIDSVGLHQGDGGNSNGVGSLWRKSRADRLPQEDKTHRSDKLERQATSHSRATRSTGKRARDQTHVAANEAGPSTQTRSSKRSKAN